MRPLYCGTVGLSSGLCGGANLGVVGQQHGCLADRGQVRVLRRVD